MSDDTRTVRLVGSLSPRDGWVAESCSLDRALKVLSTRSAMLILREAFYGTSRFEDFADRIGISHPSTSARLAELVEVGLLAKTPYQDTGSRTRMAYQLTEMGADLLPVLVGFMQWGDRWLAPDGGPVRIQHAGCGYQVLAELRCAAGHQPVIAELALTARTELPPESGTPSGIAAASTGFNPLHKEKRHV